MDSAWNRPSISVEDYHSKPRENRKKASTVKFWVKAFIDAFLIILIAVFACLLRFADVFAYWKRTNLNCSDFPMSIPNIAKNQAILNISETSILVVSFLLPLLLIFIGQFLEYVVYQVTRRGPGTESIVMRTFHILGLFLLGIFGTSLILDSMKRMYSYPRPYMGITCGNSSIPNSCWIEPSCGLFHDWTSFPSHNAGISFFALLFLSLYVYHHHLARSWKIARTVFMGGLILMALVFGASRIQLHENHHQDVWVGSVIGGALALAIMITLRGGKDEDATMERMRRILESPRMIPPVSLSKPPVGMEDPDAMGFTNPAYLRDPSRRPAPGHGFPNNQQ